jgi:hypothetical protein
VLGLIDSPYPNTPINDIDLIDTARVLCKSPIGGQGLIQQLHQEGAIYAVVPYKNDGVINVVLQHEAKCVCGPSNQVLQGFSAGKTDQMWSCEPLGKKLRVSVFNLFVSFELPRPVVEIIKSIENDGLDVARAGDCSAGCDASTERARVDLGWTPLCRDEFRNGAGFGFSALRQGKILAAAKPLRPDPVNMPMAGQDNRRHV